MGIRELRLEDHNKVVGLFGEKLEDYNFMIMDILKNKYSSEEFKVYGEVINEKLLSILIYNFGNVTYYSPYDIGIEGYKDVLKDLNFAKLSGPSNLMEKFLSYVEVEDDIKSYVGMIKDIKVKSKYSDVRVKYVETREEIEKLYYLFKSTEEYKDVVPESKEKFIEDELVRLETSNDRTAYIEVEGEMVASCATRGETTKSAIIIGVVASPNHRNKGYGTEVLVGLFNDLLDEGKTPYLFYNNPVARSVYRNLGAKEVCEWRVIFGEFKK